VTEVLAVRQLSGTSLVAGLPSLSGCSSTSYSVARASGSQESSSLSIGISCGAATSGVPWCGTGYASVSVRGAVSAVCRPQNLRNWMVSDGVPSSGVLEESRGVTRQK
jgi:hypothetical protein